MNRDQARTLSEMAWQPCLYDRNDLQMILGLTEVEANIWVWEITGSSEEVGVLHHDLVEYIQDLMTICRVPNSASELPVQGQWLLQRGWRFNPGRSVFSWMNPENGRSFNLRIALKVEMLKFYNVSEGISSRSDPDIIEGEFTVSE